MSDSRNMDSEINSLPIIMEKFRRGIIGNYSHIKGLVEPLYADLENNSDRIISYKIEYNEIQSSHCTDDSVGSNPRWGILSKRNFFGLAADFKPKEYIRPTRRNNHNSSESEKLLLRACSGRFQMQKFPQAYELFPNAIDISDILERPEEEQVRELENFYSMNNREFFEQFGVCARTNEQKLLLANCVILDSLLKGKYEDIEYIHCASDGNFYIEIIFKDSSRIYANQGGFNIFPDIVIERNQKSATVKFNPINTQEGKEELTNINELEVENVEYSGDLELIQELQKAMQEQFESQRQQVQQQNDNIVTKHKKHYERYEEIASKLLDKAGVGSYEEDYELDGLAISCIDEGRSVCIKSDELGITFLIDGEICTFSDFDNLVKVEYPSIEGDFSHSIEEKLKELEQIEPQNKEIIERLKIFVKKLEELARDEGIKQENHLEEGEKYPDNSVLILQITNSAINTSDVQQLQKALINEAEQLETTLHYDAEGK